MKQLPSSYDVIGSKEKAVAIIEAENKRKAEIVAKAIMKQHRNIKSVLRKISERKGKFRNRKYEVVNGSKNTEVIHKEYGCLLKVDPRQTYFSPRESTERQRIASKVNQNESVLIMFSGICPLAVAIEKKQPNVKEIYTIEINPKAHKYAQDNIKLNKLKKIKPFRGDVTKILRKIEKKFDRIIMPLPRDAESYLDLAIKKLNYNGIIHFYDFQREEDIPNASIEKIKKHCNPKILKVTKVGQYSPRKYRLCIDFMVKK